MADAVQVFVSHHHSPDEDAFTRRLVADLEVAGADVWVDYRGATSESFVRKISEGMAGRQWLVLVMTPASVASEWVRLEVDTALAEVKAGRMLAVIPIVMRQTPVEAIPLLWRTLLRKDATQGYEAARDELLGVLGLHSATAHNAPAPQPAIPPAARYPIPARLGSLGYQGVNLNGTPVYIPPLITIPAGPFLMGSDKSMDAAANDNETPQYWVEVDTFQIAKYPVTVAEYALAVRAGAVREPPKPDWNEITWALQLQRLDHPVVNVSWYDATAYAAWLNGATGQRGWRLPTEAEWEKAARWDQARQYSRLYPWGDEFDKNCCNSGASNNKMTSPIGSYPASDLTRSGASPHGVEEMAGNVWEWTSSLYQPYPYIHSDGRENQKSTNTRIFRGGAWSDYPAVVRAALRSGGLPGGLNDGIGFRLVRASPGS